MANFDIAGARAAGYSDQEISDHLAQSQGFNINQARAAGYNDTELVNHLTGSQSKVQPAAKVGSESGPDDPGVLGTIGIAAGHATDKIIDGMTQAWLGLSGGTNSTKQALKDSVDEKTRIYQPLQDAHPVATAVGETVPSLAVPVGAAGTGGAALAKLALQGAAVPALQYGSVGERATGAGIGGVGSAVGGAVLPAVGRAVGGGISNVTSKAANVFDTNITPEVAALYNKAQSLGIPVSRAQLSDSTFLKTIASQIEKLPFTGGTAARETQQNAFNQAVSRTIGEDSPVVNQALYSSAKKRIGGEFERLSSQNNLQVTPALMNDVNQVITNADKFGTADTSRIVRNIAGDLRNHLDTNTMTIPGKAYQSLDSQMTTLMKNGDPASVHIGSLQSAVRSAMDHSISPEDQAAWMTARNQYKNLKAIRDIVGKGNADGDISPALLMGRLNSTGAGKESMASGTRGDLGDIAQVGQQFVKDRIPNSGTAQRMVASTMLGGGMGVAGVVPALTVAATAATSGRMLNSALNTGASGAKAFANSSVKGTVAAPATLGELLSKVSSPMTQKVGGTVGRSLADYSNR